MGSAGILHKTRVLLWGESAESALERKVCSLYHNQLLEGTHANNWIAYSENRLFHPSELSMDGLLSPRLTTNDRLSVV